MSSIRSESCTDAQRRSASRCVRYPGLRMPTARPPSPRVLFDEAHAEAWTIRPEVARGMQPAHPADSSYAARPPTRCAARDFAVDAHAEGPLDAAALDGADVLVIAHPSEPALGARRARRRRRASADAELDAIEAFVARRRRPGRARRGASRTSTATTSTSCSRASASRSTTTSSQRLRAPPPARRTGSSPTWRTRAAAVDLLARVRRGVLLPRRRRWTPGRRRARCCARTSPTASAPRRAAARRRRARRGPRRRAGRLRPLRRRLPRRARPRGAVAQPRPLGRRAAPSPHEPAPVRSDAAADPALGARCSDATDALRLLQAARRRARPDADRRRGAARHVERDGRGDRRRSRRASPHQADYLDGGRSPTCARGPTAASASPTSPRSLERFRPDLHRADGIEHLVVFPMYKQNGSRDTRLRGADRRACRGRSGWPSSSATRYDNAKFVPVDARRPHRRLRLASARCCSPRPCQRRRPAGQPLRRRSSATARPARFRARRRRARPSCCGSTCRPTPPRCWLSERLSRDAYDAVGPRPRPRAQPRRPAVRPVHDPPADAVLDVLAGGAALRPDRVRRGGRRSSARASRSRATSSTRSSSTGCSASRSPGTRVRNYDGLGGQLLFAYLHRHGCVHWTDNRLTIEWDARRRRRRSRCASAVEALYRDGHRPLEARALGRGARPRRRRYVPAGDGLARGRAGARDVRRGRGPAAVHRRGRCPTSSRCRCSTPRSRASSSPRSTAAAPSSARSWPHERRLDGRVIAVAGAGGALGPVVVARAGRRRARASRPTDRDRGRCSPSLGDAAAHTATADLLDADGASPGRRGRRRPRRASTALAAPRRRLARRQAARRGAARGPRPPRALLFRTVVHTTRAFRRRPAAAGDRGRFALVSAAAGPAPDGRQRRLRGDKAAAEAWTLALRRRSWPSTAAPRTSWSSTRSSRRRCAPSTRRRPTGPSPTPRRSPRRSSSSARDAARKMNGQRLSLHGG